MYEDECWYCELCAAHYPASAVTVSAAPSG
jgi:NAD-dependent dihydropyrimidine dehydrogenase PreA subunit